MFPWIERGRDAAPVFTLDYSPPFQTNSRALRVLWYVRELARNGFPARIIAAYDGVGDELMTAAAVREMHARGWKNTWFLTRYPGLLRQGEIGCRFLVWHPYYFALARRLKTAVFRPEYCRYITEEDRYIPQPGHAIANLCRSLGARGIIGLKPYLQLSERERAGGRIFPKQIAVQSSGLGARLPITTKQWPPERMQQVVAALSQDGHHVVQLGLSSEPPLAGTLDLRGKLTLRETGAVLSQSRLFIGLVGGLMHMARAVDCRAVIVYGGRELASQSGYRANANLAASPGCSPCYLRSNCPHDLICLTGIGAEAVVQAARSQLRREDPLENETVSI